MNEIHKSLAVSKDVVSGSVEDVNTLLSRQHAADKKEGAIFGFVMALIEAHRFVQNRRSALNDPF